jgi:hypothetical protein
MLPVCVPAAWGTDVVKPLKAEEFAVRYAYHFELLHAVLEKTVAEFGPYREEAFTAPMSSPREHEEALLGNLINVMISDAGHKEIDEGMIPVPFPIDKGLLGYRVSLISAHNQAKVAAVNTLEDLRRLVVGQGVNWGDVAIYEYNEIPVETAMDYNSLFPMLLRGRFDLFPRGVTEAPQELAAYGAQYPDLAIDAHLLIKYRYAQFFYISKSAPHLAERLLAGLEQMARDGSFDALFSRHFAESLASLKLGRRIVIELENPFLPAWVPFNRAELWFDPQRF